MVDLDAYVAAVQMLPQDWFAVIDGGHFNHLPSLLSQHGLSGVGLYLEGGAPEVRQAAGFLVPLPDIEQLRRALALVGDLPAMVVWSWPDSSSSIYRHLRTLNLVELPNEARAKAERDGEDLSGMPAYETVLFRHWDPNVLGGLLPLMRSDQISRFLGVGTGLAFAAPDYGGLNATSRPSDLPPLAHGMLKFTPEQMDAFRQERVESSQRRIADYLAETVPSRLLAPYRANMADLIQQEAAVGRSLGLETERDHARWTFLQLLSGRKLHEQPAIRSLFHDPRMSGSATDRLEQLFHEIGARAAGRS